MRGSLVILNVVPAFRDVVKDLFLIESRSFGLRRLEHQVPASVPKLLSFSKKHLRMTNNKKKMRLLII